MCKCDGWLMSVAEGNACDIMIYHWIYTQSIGWVFQAHRVCMEAKDKGSWQNTYYA